MTDFFQRLIDVQKSRTRSTAFSLPSAEEASVGIEQNPETPEVPPLTPRLSFVHPRIEEPANDASEVTKIETEVLEEEECSICKDPYNSADAHEIAVTLPCGHQVGHECLHQWVNTDQANHGKCPHCRALLHEDRMISRIKKGLKIHMDSLSAQGLDNEERISVAYSRLRKQAAERAAAGVICSSLDCLG